MISRWMKFVAVTLAVAFVAVLGTPIARSQSLFNYFWWQAVDEYGNPYTGENVRCSVYEPNGGLKRMHTTTAMTAAIDTGVLNTGQVGNAGSAIPPDVLISDINGRLHFYSASSNAVDVLCFYDMGGAAQLNRVTPSIHRITIPRLSEMGKVARFAYSPNTAQTNSGITLPQGTLIRDVIIQNLMVNTSTGALATAGATTLHINVGFGGNHADSTMNALVSVLGLTSALNGATGGSGGTNLTGAWIRPHMVTNIGTPGAILAGNHRGGALADYHQTVCFGGVCSAAGSVGGLSVYREHPYLVHVASGLDVTYQTSACGGGSTNAFCPHGFVFIIYDQLHMGVNRQGDSVTTSGGGGPGKL